MADRWFEEHAGEFIKTVGSIWRCGDVYCQCSYARIENLYRNKVAGDPRVVRERVWAGEFHSGEWEPGDTTAEQDLIAYRDSLTPQRQAEIEWEI